MTQPAPFGVDDVRHAYDSVAEDYAAHFPDTRAEGRLELAMIDAFVAAGGTGRDARVLDAGCGTGRISRYVADRGARVQGIDLSPGMVAMARRDHPDLSFEVGSLHALPYPDGSFAGVLLWYSVIHTPPSEQPRILQEVRRVLRPGGHVLVGFQAGEGTRDVGEVYRRFGHDVRLERFLLTADETSSRLAAVGVHEVARMVRRPGEGERDDQAAVLAKLPGPD